MTNNDREIVATFLDRLAGRIGKERFEVWFGEHPRVDWIDQKLTIDVANPFTKDWLQARFRNDVAEICEATLGAPKDIDFRWRAGGAPSGPGRRKNLDASNGKKRVPRTKANTEEPRDSEASPSSLRRRLRTLELFAAGATNQIGVAAANAIVREPGSLTPLYLHGDPGTGKTHLLEGIMEALHRRSPRLAVVYMTAESFTCGFLEALRSGGLPGFRRRYRQVDVLLIDDVQFLEGKQATQSEFQHTADDLIRNGKQLVFAADRPPAELTWLAGELISRMSGGMVCQTNRPDLEARKQIVGTLAKQRGTTLEQDVLDFIAENVTGDGRALQGAIHTLWMNSMAYGRPINVALAKAALEDVVDAPMGSPTLNEVERVVCDVCGVKPAKLHSGQRSRSASHPRMLAMWCARKYTRSALSEIGDHFGGRSHSTVVAAQKRVEQWLRADGATESFHGSMRLREAVKRIEQRLKIG